MMPFPIPLITPIPKLSNYRMPYRYIHLPPDTNTYFMMAVVEKCAICLLICLWMSKVKVCFFFNLAKQKYLTFTRLMKTNTGVLPADKEQSWRCGCNFYLWMICVRHNQLNRVGKCMLSRRNARGKPVVAEIRGKKGGRI